MLSAKLKEAAGNSADATLYVDDVFSTWLYTGNGTTQTITNGIDLAGKGGLVWLKSRSGADPHELTNTIQGISNSLRSNSTNGSGSTDLTGFTSSGFNLGYVTGNVNVSGASEVSWTFRKAAKFFDVQTVTHTNGTANNIDLSVLGTVGTVIAKITTTTGDWCVWHRGLTAGNNLVLNTTAAQSTTNAYLSVSGTTATLSASAPTGTYVIYAWAHDTASTGIIQCGSTNGNKVTLGWEPQWILYKSSNFVEAWQVVDNMRGLPVGAVAQLLNPNTSGAETTTSNSITIAADGFTLGAITGTAIYMAIRRPNKPPTTGTQVFSPNSFTGASVPVVTNFPVDTSFYREADVAFSEEAFTRLQGIDVYLTTPSTSAQQLSYLSANYFASNTTFCGSGDGNSRKRTYWNFKRTPGFFDVVCYTGTGVARTVAHNLGVAPELIIVKDRTSAFGWPVYAAPLGNANGLQLEQTAAAFATSWWNSTSPSSSVFNVSSNAGLNLASDNYVAYLFATLAGISKVGSYTGNGTGQAIACGFGSGGARFVLIKRTDSTGSWYTFDSARGLTSGSSPYLLLNSTAAEVTGNNGVYASSGGFTLGATAITTTNIATATYIFLAVA